MAVQIAFGPAVQAAITSITGSLVSGAILGSFSETSQEICLCLNEINNTLLDGFSGLDVRAEAEEEAGVLDLSFK